MRKVVLDEAIHGEDATSQVPGRQGQPKLDHAAGRAVNFSRGAFMAIRNPLAHHGGTDFEQHEALELLSVFSVSARWVEECSVKSPVAA
ncbi:TIGR02391 family protein [Zafaria cholistanensis]|uniref:TIGR02391 family protein n=1 Tax=Zafaria cholistanensis TaxID=1682741 RepID=UPI0039C970D2